MLFGASLNDGREVMRLIRHEGVLMEIDIIRFLGRGQRQMHRPTRRDVSRQSV